MKSELPIIFFKLGSGPATQVPKDLELLEHQYLTLFSLDEKSQTTIICEPEKVSYLVHEFKQLGIVLKTYDEIGKIFK